MLRRAPTIRREPVHIWRYRGEEEICRLQVLTDTLESARILGIV